jgi:hypothetical protein
MGGLGRDASRRPRRSGDGGLRVEAIHGEENGNSRDVHAYHDSDRDEPPRVLGMAAAVGVDSGLSPSQLPAPEAPDWSCSITWSMLMLPVLWLGGKSFKLWMN